MTEEMKIEELLNSYIDGELSVRQRTEVKRMTANDPNIAKRLRQLQKCRALVSALPVAQAPSSVLENVKATMQAKTRSNEKLVSTSGYKRGKIGFFLFRKVFAAAAMLSFAAILVIVINMLIPSNTGDPGSFPNIASDVRFSGTLELKTNDLSGVQSFISKAIDNTGYTNSATPVRDSNRRIYTLNCSRESLNKILSDLEDNWDKLYSAELFVDTKVFGESVEVAAVTPSQISVILNQKDTEQSLDVARNMSVVNSLNELLSNRGITSTGESVSLGMLRISQPIIVEYIQPVQQENGEKTIQLRIILSR